MKMLQQIPAFLKNKFFLASLAFAIWMIFFDRNDLISQWSRASKLRDLENSSAFYNRQIQSATQELELRKTDPAAYERVAREKYYMKRNNEDVFLFEE